MLLGSRVQILNKEAGNEHTDKRQHRAEALSGANLIWALLFIERRCDISQYNPNANILFMLCSPNAGLH